jgi:CRP-like cAMP-binding protein
MPQQDLLRNIYLFRDLTPEEMNKIGALVELETFVPGDEIFTQGDKAVSLLVIRYGSVRVIKSMSEGSLEVANLGSGSHFGEMALLDHEPRSATVVASEKTELIRIDYEALNKVLLEHPPIANKFYKAIAHFLCGRLRLTTKDLTFAREQSLHLI